MALITDASYMFFFQLLTPRRTSFTNFTMTAVSVYTVSLKHRNRCTSFPNNVSKNMQSASHSSKHLHGQAESTGWTKMDHCKHDVKLVYTIPSKSTINALIMYISRSKNSTCYTACLKHHRHSFWQSVWCLFHCVLDLSLIHI